MTKREIVRTALEHRPPPYVPWSFGFTVEARARLADHLAADALPDVLQDHLLGLSSAVGRFTPAGPDRVRDIFGVVWDRSVDKDIGCVERPLLQKPTLEGYQFPDPRDPAFFEDIPARIEADPDRFRVYRLGFSLYERAWTLRGMTNLLMDFHDHPAFVHRLLGAIADWNLAHVREALRYEVDAVYFGDDWGQQHGLQMGPGLWREFIAPQLRRMYGAVRESGRFVFIHSCGDVDELFEELIGLGVNCFNPFQPEVMDTAALMRRYRGRLSFHGGLSTQRTLPYGTPEEVRAETRRLLALGADGDYIFAPAHAVEGDVPLQNMLAFIEEVKAQPGFAGE